MEGMETLEEFTKKLSSQVGPFITISNIYHLFVFCLIQDRSTHMITYIYCKIQAVDSSHEHFAIYKNLARNRKDNAKRRMKSAIENLEETAIYESALKTHEQFMKY